ncbi:MAG: hypothetical protein KDH96_04760 [Candidatus Riesia sp.]|nr:hypothetical protein [Candidatus Riesia sp.]
MKQKTIKFKGSVLVLDKLVQNILEVFYQCSSEDKVDWYVDANNFAGYLEKEYFKELKGNFNQRMAKSCGIIAALSPLKTWEENKKIAESFLKQGKAKHTKLFTNKAKDILTSTGTEEEIVAILKGDKISAFFLNILNPKDSSFLTIDRHAICIALGREATENEKKLTTSQYRFFELAYTIASSKVGVRPILMQSSTWVRWRKDKTEEVLDLTDTPF